MNQKYPDGTREIVTLYYTVVFLVIALIAGALGFFGIAGAAVGIAKILFFVFLVLFVVSLIMGRRARPPYSATTGRLIDIDFSLLNTASNRKEIICMDTPLRPAKIRRALATIGVATGLGFCLVGNAAPSDTAPTAHSDSVGAAIDDAAITTKVKSTFLGNDRLKGSHIKVTTTNGVVTLRGSAPSADSKAAAEELARNVNGVKSIDDELTTAASNGPMHKAVAKTERVGSDSWITTKVKSEILADSISKGFEVRVKTVNGVVMLHGTLPNQDAVEHVKGLAEKVKGVKSVNITQLKSSAG